jgi:transcriptional regulator with XRE-family HTH domain
MSSGCASRSQAAAKQEIEALTGAQIRAARALIRWSAEDLARESALGVTTIRRAELTESETSMTTVNDLAVRRALEAAGVMFIDEDDTTGPGVRPAMNKPQAVRPLLRWSADDLARESELSLSTIKRTELADDETSMTVANDLAVRRALEAAGVIFIDENGDAGPGVRLRKRHGKSA